MGDLLICCIVSGAEQAADEGALVATAATVDAPAIEAATMAGTARPSSSLICSVVRRVQSLTVSCARAPWRLLSLAVWLVTPQQQGAAHVGGARVLFGRAMFMNIRVVQSSAAEQRTSAEQRICEGVTCQ